MEIKHIEGNKFRAELTHFDLTNRPDHPTYYRRGVEREVSGVVGSARA
jgi:hypothetical protein